MRPAPVHHAATASGVSTGADVRIVEPSENHYYQPGWTMVGAGVFKPQRTQRRTEDLIPNGAQWGMDGLVLTLLVWLLGYEWVKKLPRAEKE